jgi:hypothetical protein
VSENNRRMSVMQETLAFKEIKNHATSLGKLKLIIIDLLSYTLNGKGRNPFLLNYFMILNISC